MRRSSGTGSLSWCVRAGVNLLTGSRGIEAQRGDGGLDLPQLRLDQGLVAANL